MSSVIRKALTNGNCVRLRNFLGSSRNLNLSANELSDKYVIKSDLSDVDIPNLTIPEVIEPKFQEYGNLTAVKCALTGQEYTYQQLSISIRRLSKSLRKILKLEKDDKVAIISRNSPDYVVSAFGIIRSGCMVTTLNPLYTPEEISKQLTDSGAKAVLAQTSLVPKVMKAFEILKKKLPVITIKEKSTDGIPEGTINFHELITTEVDIPEIDLGNCSNTAFIPYSSGTTGLPKGVELSHNNLIANLSQAMHPELFYLTPPEDQDQNIIPLVLPMYHIYGFTLGMLMTLYNGARLITLPQFTPQLYIDVLRNYGVTQIFAAPPLVLFLINHPEVKRELFSRLRVVVSGAAPLGYTDELKLKEKINKDEVMVMQGYGLTETSPLVTVAPNSFKSSPETGGTIGKLLPNTAAKIISVTDESSKPLGPNVEGELLLKGPQVMKGYYRKPEETKKSFLDGWFRTGDIGYYNDDGYFFITERLKELIKVKGFQVPPAELEAVIRTHPEIADVGVIGIPDPAQGEVPRAYVVPKNKDKLNVKELQEYVAAKVAKYKRLAGGVQIMDTIPRNPSGKILRRELKQNFLEKGI